ncbi:MAG: hypothetical protein ACLRWQ_05750 [Flavonifractor plautii]
MCRGLAVVLYPLRPGGVRLDGGLDFDFAGSASFCPCWCSPWPGGRRRPRLAADASGPAARKGGAALMHLPVPR